MNEVKIDSDEQHAASLKELESLIERNDPENPKDGDWIRELAIAIEEYEKKKFPTLSPK